MNKEQLAEIILNVLQKSNFKEWIDTVLEDYITGEENALTKEQILKDLQWYLPSELR